MPTAWRVHVIEATLQAAGLDVAVSDCDVYALPPVERTRVVDVLIAEQTSFPMVRGGRRGRLPCCAWPRGHRARCQAAV